MSQNKPYIRNKDSFYYSDDYYTKLKVPFNYGDYLKLTNELISEENFYKNEKEEIIKKIYNDLSFIHQQLEPLYKLGIVFEFNLVGGAVRDFVLNRHEKIKDLDIMIHCDMRWKENIVDNINRPFLDIENKITVENLLDIGFEEYEINKINFGNKNVDDSNCQLVINQLIQLCLRKNKNNNLKEFMAKRRSSVVEDCEKYGKIIVENKMPVLIGVIKVENEVLNFPIDILISRVNLYNFLETFDFNFCKASLVMVNRNNNWCLNFPRSYKNLIPRFYGSYDFFADVLNKKMTVEANIKNDASINKTAIRYFNIQDKYTDFILNIVNSEFGVENGKKEILLAKILDKKIPESNIGNSNRNKI